MLFSFARKLTPVNVSAPQTPWMYLRGPASKGRKDGKEGQGERRRKNRGKEKREGRGAEEKGREKGKGEGEGLCHGCWGWMR